MEDILLSNDVVIRGACFVVVLAVIAGWEHGAPRREPQAPRRLRWPGNLGVAVLDTLVVRLAFPLLAVAFAVSAERLGWGLLNMLTVPLWLRMAVSLLLLDLAIYCQHVLFHVVPSLWRLHRMHHADVEFDVTTGLRFHPLEVMLSMAIKLAVIAALGPPALAVLCFEVLLNATALFNHGNIRISPRVDRVLRWLVVTPDMHRVHHSIERGETNSNFGFSLPWWDRLFGTYLAQPKQGHERMTIGLESFRAPRDLRLDRMLIQPMLDANSGFTQAAHKTTMSESSTRSPR